MSCVTPLYLVALATLAVAEPVVVRFPDLTHEARVDQLNNRLPPLMLDMTTGAFPDPFMVWIAPALFADFVDAEGESTCTHGVQGLRPDFHAGYLPIFLCFGADGPQFPYQYVYPLCNDCDWTDRESFVLEGRYDRYLLPIRIGDELNATSWHYGWIAYEYVQYLNASCADTCHSSTVYYPEINFLGFGYETTPDIPIVPGGGLCAADFNLDALIDLADIAAFVNGFLDQSPIADLSPDGIFDLDDIVVFVTAFHDGCELGVLP